MSISVWDWNSSTDGTSYQIGNGYDVINTFQAFLLASLSGLSLTPTTESKYETVYSTETIWVPPIAAVAGVPAIEATQTSFEYTKRTGWNTWARSNMAFTKGFMYKFSCPKNSNGVFLGIGPSDSLGLPISLFSHAIVVDLSGICIYESGLVVKTLVSNFDGQAFINIFYQEDSSIIYTVQVGLETTIHKSSVPNKVLDSYVFGYLYTSDEEVTTSEFLAGSVQYGRI